MAKNYNTNEAVQLAKEYGIQIYDVYLAYLISNGVPNEDAYIAIYRPDSIYTKKIADNYIKANSGLTRLIAKLKRKEKNISDPNNDSGVMQFRDKDSVLSEIEKQIMFLSGKDKLDALKIVADLQQLKKDEDKEKEKVIHFYLPMKICKDCDKR